MSLSPQEKENLKKKLQKLFQKESFVNRSSNHDPKGTTHINNTKKAEGLKIPEVAPNQIGLSKPALRQNSGNKYTKSQHFKSKPDKSKIQQKKSDAAEKTNEKLSSRKLSQNNNMKISRAEKQIEEDKISLNHKKSKSSGNKCQNIPEKAKIESPQKQSKVKKQIKAEQIFQKPMQKTDFGNKGQEMLENTKVDRPKKQNNVKKELIIPKPKKIKCVSNKSPERFQKTNAKIPQKKINKEKQIIPKPKKMKDFGNKSRLENTTIESVQKDNSVKQCKSDIHQQNSGNSSYRNTNENLSKQAKKRVASNSTAVSNKKQKLTKKGNQKDVKIKEKRVALPDEYDSTSSQYANENNVAISATDIEFDSDSDDWMQNENFSECDSEESNMKHYNGTANEEYNENDSEADTANENFGNKQISNKIPKANTAVRKYKENSKTNRLYGKFSDSDNDFEAEYYDSDSFEEENYSDSDKYDEEDDISSEEEEENYSDDYEEEENYSDYGEEDSYYYSSDSGNEYFTDNDEFHDILHNYYHEDSDKDYELPRHIPEDLIIHKGTCTKRDIKPDDNVSFDSENEEPQIVELENEQTVKIIEQPEAYDRKELLKLKYEEKTLSSVTFQKIASVSCDDEDCPKLVPIVDEEGFELFNPNAKLDDDEEESENCEDQSVEEYGYDEDVDYVSSLGSEYTEVDSDDADSLLSENINEKYLNIYNDTSNSDDNIDEDILMKKQKADVIDATGYKFENIMTDTNDHQAVTLNDDIMQIPSVNLYKNVDLKTESSILSTTIIDNKIHFSNDNFKRCLNIELIEAKEGISTTREDVSKDDEHNTDASPIVTDPYVQSSVKYKTKFFNAFNSNLVIALVKDPFYIYGTVRLTLLAGSMEVYGHSLKLNTEVEIFSPRGCSVIEISSLPTKNSISNEKLQELLKLYEQQFALNDLKKIASLYNAETDAVVLLKRNDERKKVVQQYKKFMNENVFPNINNINSERTLYNSEYLLRCMINTSPQEQKCLRLPKKWQEFELTSKSRVMLAGGKGVGKSTLLRYLINRHLPQKVLLIDLDIGQPEVFVPQTVSCTIIEQPLLGPGFLLNLQPEISFAVGHTNIVLCAHKYLSAVHSLIAYCSEQEAFKDIPWVINTMGYNKGFGLELISVLVHGPLTDVIQLQSSKEINNFESTLEAHVLSNVPHILFSEEYERIMKEIKESWNYRLHVWPSAVQQESRYQREWEMSAKDSRFAMLLARLSQALQGHADWLTDIKPLSASLNDLKIINLMDNTPLISADELENSIEANLVYLCHYEEDDKPLRCLGIGVVRAIDLHVRHLYLIPALSYNHIKDVNCLAIGEMPLPTSLFTNQGSRVKNIAPFVYETVAASASKAIKQIYHRPAKFLTGKYKPLDD